MKSPKYSRLRHPSQYKSEGRGGLRLIQIILALFTAIWLLAVVKVFLLEKSRVELGEVATVLDDHETVHSSGTVAVKASSRRISSMVYKSKFDTDKRKNEIALRDAESVPRFGDWAILRAPISEPKAPDLRPPRPELKQLKAPKLPEPPGSIEVKPANVIKAPIVVKAPEYEASAPSLVRAGQESVTTGKDHLAAHDWVRSSELTWPPLQADGSIREQDGYEVMALTGLKVPRFWAPPDGVDPVDSISEIGGNPTIFLMIASYRDFQCRETIEMAFQRADHPENLFVGAVDQVVDGDTGCLDIEIPCIKNPNQMICKYLDHISVFKMDAKLATGPVTARHIGYRLYRGQHFYMQMDAHCQSVRHWDTKIISQWKSTGNEMAVLSSYLTDVQGSIDKNGDSTRNTRPIMCNSEFEGQMPAQYIRHQSQPEEQPAIKDMPQMQPYWAAGFSFSRGHFIVQVPYDAYLSMVFMGEEISIGVRGFTFGYDHYAPRESVVFHEYASMSNRRKKVPMFWENQAEHRGAGFKALKRLTSIIRMATDIPPNDWDHSEEQRYGLGTVRSPELFYKLFLIDTKNRKSTQLCPFVKSGKMHINFQPYLRKDGRGIDYSHLESFDTMAVIEKVFQGQRPFGEDMLRNAIKLNSREDLTIAVNNAKRIGLDKSNEPLYQRAISALNAL
jgi:hypothetical protein